MDFEEAKKYLDDNLNVIGEYATENKPQKIECLFIAPKFKAPQERLKVLELIYSGNDNLTALSKLYWLHENLDVYFYASDDKEKFPGLLYDFLSNKKS